MLPWHVPLVAPGGISQVYPVQQSFVTVQAPPWPWHGGRQTSSQIDEQHCAAVVQPLPFGRHDEHVPPMQLPTQHGVPPAVQAASGRRQPGGGVGFVAQT